MTLTKTVFFSSIVGLIFGLSVFASPVASALDVPARDTVVDVADVLSDEEETNLKESILSNEGSNISLAILIIPNLDGEALEFYTLKVAREWGLGDSETDAGVLILASIEDRRLRIETGTGAEGFITDAESGRVINQQITPEFREERYYEGLLAASVRLHELAEAGDQLGDSVTSQTESSSSFGEAIFVGFLFLQFLTSILSRSKSWWAGGIIGSVIAIASNFIFSTPLFLGLLVLTTLGLAFDKLVSANYAQAKRSGRSPSWWAGGPPRGGNSSSSRGTTFGGGSFGGGGASGSW